MITHFKVPKVLSFCILMLNLNIFIGNADGILFLFLSTPNLDPGVASGFSENHRDVVAVSFFPLSDGH